MSGRMAGAGAAVLAALSILSVGQSARAESPYPVLWTRQVHNVTADSNYGVAAVADGAYVVGYTDLYQSPKMEVVFRKYDAQGTLEWTRQFGTVGYDDARGVALDGLGHVYVGGRFFGSGNDVFVSQYDTSGNLNWSRQLDAIDDMTLGTAADRQGNAFICGRTNGTMSGQNAGGYDGFVCKYDVAGDLQWKYQLGTLGYDEAKSLAVDAAGNVYVTGTAGGRLPGATSGGAGAFVCKLDSAGHLVWIDQPGGNGGYGIATDDAGQVYVTGSTSDVNRMSDVLLIQYDLNGNKHWTREFGSSDSDYGYGVAVDWNRDILLTGRTNGNMSGANAGGADVFLSKLDPDGNLLWTEQMGSTKDDIPYGISTDPQGNVYVAGETGGVFGGSGTGYTEAFLMKFAPEPATLSLFFLGGLAVILKSRR